MVEPRAEKLPTEGARALAEMPEGWREELAEAVRLHDIPRLRAAVDANPWCLHPGFMLDVAFIPDTSVRVPLLLLAIVYATRYNDPEFAAVLKWLLAYSAPPAPPQAAAPRKMCPSARVTMQAIVPPGREIVVTPLSAAMSFAARHPRDFKMRGASEMQTRCVRAARLLLAAGADASEPLRLESVTDETYRYESSFLYVALRLQVPEPAFAADVVAAGSRLLPEEHEHALGVCFADTVPVNTLMRLHWLLPTYERRLLLDPLTGERTARNEAWALRRWLSWCRGAFGAAEEAEKEELAYGALDALLRLGVCIRANASFRLAEIPACVAAGERVRHAARERALRTIYVERALARLPLELQTNIARRAGGEGVPWALRLGSMADAARRREAIESARSALPIIEAIEAFDAFVADYLTMPP